MKVDGLAPAFVLFVGACAAPAGHARKDAERSAVLGATTEAPTDELAEARGLERFHRWRGRVVAEVVPDGPADAAGIRAGDVLVRLDRVELYSADDVADVLSVHAPGDTVAVEVLRADGSRAELELTLGSGPPRESSGIRWQYASLAHLPAALEEARATKKKVLVGLSGAET